MGSWPGRGRKEGTGGERDRRRGVGHGPGPNRKRQPQAMPCEGLGTMFPGQGGLALNGKLFVCCLVVATDVSSCSGCFGGRRERGGVQQGEAAWQGGWPGLAQELWRDRCAVGQLDRGYGPPPPSPRIPGQPQNEQGHHWVKEEVHPRGPLASSLCSQAVLNVIVTGRAAYIEMLLASSFIMAKN